MLIGAIAINQVNEKSTCRISENYYITMVGDYKIHSTTLMSEIPFKQATEVVTSIDSSIFSNWDHSNNKPMLYFPPTVKVQNYLTTKYIGNFPFFYGPKTPLGTEFQLVCQNGSPIYSERYFGTSEAILGRTEEMITMKRSTDRR